MNYTTLSHVSEIRQLNLEQILQSFPQRKFILLGETSNADIMAQYPVMAKKYIDRVQCVLLRNTSATDSGDFLPVSSDTSSLTSLTNSIYSMIHRVWSIWISRDGCFSGLP
jgi:phosphatidate phosphatase APP1